MLLRKEFQLVVRVQYSTPACNRPVKIFFYVVHNLIFLCPCVFIRYMQKNFVSKKNGKGIVKKKKINKVLSHHHFKIGFNFNVRAVNVRAKEHTPFSG